MENRDIAKATLRFIDDNGIEAVSFRKISQKTGVATMTISNRFGSKDGLLRAALQVMLDEMPPEEHIPGEPWDSSLRRVAHHNRAMALAHPRAFILFLQVPPFESPVKEYTEKVFSLHSGQGLPEGMPYVFLSLMHSFLTGFQLAESYMSVEMAKGTPSQDALPFARMFDEEAFERNIDIIIAGLAQRFGLPLQAERADTGE